MTIDLCICGHEKTDHANLGGRGGDFYYIGCGRCACSLFYRIPKQLDCVADVVLAYRPKAKSKPARRRKRRANKMAKER
jgi:hypothetical protein